MTAFAVSAGIVALAEIGDKTQLLALLLAARFRRPVPIALGILAATLANHALAGLVGAWLTTNVDPTALRFALGFGFIAMAAWSLVPDGRPDEPKALTRCGVFVATTVAFFVVEIGDKTQVATVGLAARFDELAAVVFGTTVGMLAANVPAVLLGDAVTKRVPLRTIRALAAAVFATLGLAVLIFG